MSYSRQLVFSIITAIKMLAISSTFASTQIPSLDTEIKNLTNTVLKANVSDEPLKACIESTGRLIEFVEILTQRDAIRDDQRRFLELIKDEILDLQSLLISAISRTHPEVLDDERVKMRYDSYQVVINEDIKHEAFKHKLKAMIDYIQKQLTKPESQRSKRKSLEWEHLILDLTTYGNSKDRTDTEKAEYDLYMSVIGPHNRSITYRPQELN
ncbi:hypothetical protein [Candidatus Bodocaedibacter vickermanii]|uniref:Uncharacterized protein n=1 Tax=Candidatus Bodocaedibacter vickermanii TaxID=2741701 RepID=A0A7L9RSC3_9PROT|nr:hypothetical protein CPBP_00188 [Candidatus Paracaedibacteraceae bacterium 'Lake Konstanz']